ncbi:MAG: hypothetical protein Q9218_001853 [Villophora microphyllina]
MAATARKGIFGLALELREQIYDFVLPSCRDGPLLYVTEKRTFSCTHTEAKNLRLLLVHPQIYAEGMDLLLRKNKVGVRLDINSNMTRQIPTTGLPSPTFFSAVPTLWEPRLRSQIREVKHLTFEVELDRNWRAINNTIDHVMEILQLGKGSMHLEIVVLNLSQKPLARGSQHLALEPFHRLATMKINMVSIKMVNVPAQTSQNFKYTMQNAGWRGKFVEAASPRSDEGKTTGNGRWLL